MDDEATKGGANTGAAVDGRRSQQVLLTQLPPFCGPGPSNTSTLSARGSLLLALDSFSQICKPERLLLSSYTRVALTLAIDCFTGLKVLAELHLVNWRPRPPQHSCGAGGSGGQPDNVGAFVQ